MQASKDFDYQALMVTSTITVIFHTPTGVWTMPSKTQRYAWILPPLPVMPRWPDLDEHDPRIQHIVQFHQRGFTKLHKNWDNYLDRISKAETAHQIVLFPN